MARRRDFDTLDIFRDYEPPQSVAAVLDPEIVKGGTLSAQIARALSQAMNDCDKSRAQIADEMSDYLGFHADERGRRSNGAVTANMLDTYASQARTDHKITMERFVALVVVTGAIDLLALACQPAGYVAVPRQYEAVIRMHRVRELKDRLAREEAAIDAELKGWRS